MNFNIASKLNKRVAAAVVSVAMLCCLIGCGAAEEPVSSVPETASEVQESMTRAIDTTVFAVSAVDLPMPEKPQAMVEYTAEVYAQAEPSEIIFYVETGEQLTYTETDDPMWYEITAEGGTGYVYGEYLFAIDENGEADDDSLTAQALEEKLDFLREKLPEGKYWNHAGQELKWGEESPFIVTDTPCNHNVSGSAYCNFYNGATLSEFSYSALCQCLGFASLLSDQLFGRDAPLHTFYDPALLRVGDHIRLDEYEHSMTVTEITDEYITIAEANENYQDCKISWSRRLTFDELRALNWDCEFISRYPLCPTEGGGFAPWPD